MVVVYSVKMEIPCVPFEGTSSNQPLQKLSPLPARARRYRRRGKAAIAPYHLIKLVCLFYVIPVCVFIVLLLPEV